MTADRASSPPRNTLAVFQAYAAFIDAYPAMTPLDVDGEPFRKAGRWNQKPFVPSVRSDDRLHQWPSAVFVLARRS